MKKILILTMLISFSTIASAQLLGKWILPTIEVVGNTHETHIISFMQNGIQSEKLLVNLPTGYDSYCELSAGGYLPNYDLEFYTLMENFCYGSQSFDWASPNAFGPDNFHPEYQIINRPGYYDRFYSFYSGKDDNGGDELGAYFYYNEIWYENNEWQVSVHHNIYGGVEPDGMISFGISDVVNSAQYVYASTANSSTSIEAGIKRWELTGNGITYGIYNDIIDATNSDFIEEDFWAYNMEIITKSNGDNVLAWISKEAGSNDKVFICYDEIDVNVDYDIWDLNKGRIGGIEFSPNDVNVLYVSTLQSGIIAINYTTGQIIQQISATNNFNYTFLQEAPDGHIYAVSNDGKHLGRINEQLNIFETSVFDIPDYQIGFILSTFREFDGVKYFILPENSRTLDPLVFTLETEYITCPGDCDGFAEVFPTGGTEPYSFNWKNSSGVSIGTTSAISNLCEGEYTCCITDELNDEYCENFVIEVDPNLFTKDIWPIGTNTTLSWQNERIETELRVYNNTVLTLNHCYFEFGKFAKVIIEPGSTIIMDHTTFSSLVQCPNMWQGIEVWGNTDESQLIHPNNGIQWQGKLILNDATIEHALIAVDLWKPGNTHKTGGIIAADGSNFINNQRAVHAVHYSNKNPISGAKMDNVSYFKYCTFDINSSYLADVDFYKHVDLVNVDGTKFRACDFSVQQGVAGVTPWTIGIAAYSAGFDVMDVCATPNQTQCTQYDQCTFTGFNHGIYAANTSSTYTFSVKNAEFNNNATGIYASDVDYLSVLFSQFNVAKNTADQQACEAKGQKASGFGIDLFGCMGFAIEENHFTPGSTGGTYTGIRVNETNAADEIYKNYFNGLSYGNYAVGQNWTSGQQWKGLAYYCNENTGNWQDFYVEDVPLQPDGIQDPQGSELMPAGNTFSPNAYFHFNNWDDNDWIGYYYYAPAPGVTNTVYYPEYINRITREPVVGIQNTCLSHYGGGGSGGGTGRGLVLTPGEKQETELAFASNLSSYNNVKTLYDNLKDGGNTDATLTDIETSWPNDMWELRAKLLGDSPHLSMEVLKATADKTDVLPDNVIFEILAANPDELKKEELIKYLEDKENPLPGYMIDILKQVAMGSTYKTVLIRHLAHYNQVKTRAAYDIVRSILNDSVTDFNELRNWLDNIGGKRADEQIIASYLSEGNFTDATALANMMPALYDYSNDEMAEHNYFMEMLNLQISLANEERTIFDLDSTEVNNLVLIADNSNGTAGAQAKGILEFAFGYHYCNCINADSSGYKSSSKFNPNSFEQLLGIEITIEPNPVNEWAAFNYKLPETHAEGTIKISDISGKIVEILPISGKQGQKIWDTRKIKPGVYFYTLNVSGFNKSGKIIVSK
jgi:hypothetical protein